MSVLLQRKNMGRQNPLIWEVIDMYNLLVSGGVAASFLQVVPITCLVGVIYILCRGIQIKRQGSGINWRIEVIRLLFVCYLTGLLSLTIVPSNFWSNFWAIVFVGYSGSELTFFDGGFNFVPSLVKWLHGDLLLGSWVKTMLVGNVLMFVPMGVFLPLTFPRMSRQKLWLSAFIIPIIIEIIQPIVGRSFDTDDLICNFLGILIGYLAAHFIKKAIY